MSHVTPAIPDSAQAAGEEWVKSKRLPVFIKAYEHNYKHPKDCPCCAGVGVVCLQFTDGGPYSSVTTTMKVVTWYEGDGRFGKGWYTIEKTRTYLCPMCQAKPIDPDPAIEPSRVAELIASFVKASK